MIRHARFIPLLLVVFLLMIPFMVLHAMNVVVGYLSSYIAAASWTVEQVMDVCAQKIVAYVDHKFGLD